MKRVPILSSHKTKESISFSLLALSRIENKLVWGSEPPSCDLLQHLRPVEFAPDLLYILENADEDSCELWIVL